jgi:hypothetical protein
LESESESFGGIFYVDVSIVVASRFSDIQEYFFEQNFFEGLKKHLSSKIREECGCSVFRRLLFSIYRATEGIIEDEFSARKTEEKSFVICEQIENISRDSFCEGIYMRIMQGSERKHESFFGMFRNSLDIFDESHRESYCLRTNIGDWRRRNYRFFELVYEVSKGDDERSFYLLRIEMWRKNILECTGEILSKIPKGW